MAKNEGTKVVIGGPGIGIAGILTIIFVIMKCLGHLTWSWWWVFAPLWISAGLGIGILFLIGIVLLIVYLANK